jgi:hypothetical protein
MLRANPARLLGLDQETSRANCGRSISVPPGTGPGHLQILA